MIIRFKFYKKGLFKYLSHLDMLAILARTFRRSGIKIQMTGGFHPKPKISMSNPIPLGVESFAEYCDVEPIEEISAGEFVAIMNKYLPENAKIINASAFYGKVPSLMSQIDLIAYEFILSKYNDKTIPGDLKGIFDKYFLEEAGKYSAAVPDSIHYFNIKKTSENIFLFKILGYAKIFKDTNIKIFKFNDFMDFFPLFLSGYKVNIDSVRKNEVFLLKDGGMQTPIETVY